MTPCCGVFPVRNNRRNVDREKCSLELTDAIVSSHAQSGSARMSLRNSTNAHKMKYYILKTAVMILSGLAVVTGLRAAGPSIEDVGEVGSFGHPALYMGATSGFVSMSTDPCPSPTPAPTPGFENNNQCFELAAAPATTSFDAADICRIKLPKKATRTIIYPVLNFFYTYAMNNPTASDGQARFPFTANLTIESAALNDPSCTDPNNGGMPCNGKLLLQFTPNRVFDDRHLDPAEHCQVRLTLTRAGNAGITKEALVESGIPQTVVDNLFTGSMTIRANVVGTAKLVDFAEFNVSLRL